jgi:large conductance mechanosensitive channel
MAKSSSGFVNFVKEQGVVGLATGLAIGGAAGAAVKAIVDGFLSPIIGFILGGSDLSANKWSVVAPKVVNGVVDTSSRSLEFGWGMIVSGVITLLATAFVVYYIVSAMGLDKLDKKKD